MQLHCDSAVLTFCLCIVQLLWSCFDIEGTKWRKLEGKINLFTFLITLLVRLCGQERTEGGGAVRIFISADGQHKQRSCTSREPL